MSSTMSPDDDALRRAFARGTPDLAEDAAEPVDPDALWGAVRGEAGADAVSVLADRMVREPALAEEWRVAREFAAMADAEGELAAPPREDHGSGAASAPSVVAAEPAANRGDYARWGGWLALAAAVVLIVMALPRGAETTYDADAGRMRGGSDGIDAVRGEGEVARAQAVLEWSEVPGAVRYELHISTVDLRVRFHEPDVGATSTRVPASVLRQAPSGTELMWRIEAPMPDGGRVISDTFVLTVR